jgi:hypothetical protein
MQSGLVIHRRDLRGSNGLSGNFGAPSSSHSIVPTLRDVTGYPVDLRCASITGRWLRISANVTDDFGNVTGLSGLSIPSHPELASDGGESWVPPTVFWGVRRCSRPRRARLGAGGSPVRSPPRWRTREPRRHAGRRGSSTAIFAAQQIFASWRIFARITLFTGQQICKWRSRS